MGRIGKHLPLVAAALVFGQELWRVQIQMQSRAARKSSTPVVRRYHKYTLLDSLVAAGYAAATGSNDWAALDGRVSGLTGEQLYGHWRRLSKHVQGTSSSELTPSRAVGAVLAKYGLSRDDVNNGRATVLAVAGAVLGIPHGAVFSLTTRMLDAVGNPLSRAAREKMTPRELADATLELVIGCFVFPHVYYLGDGGASSGECSPAKMSREGAHAAACVDALSKGGDWFDHALLTRCTTPDFSSGCLHFAVWVALWAAAPLLGVAAPMTHSNQLGSAGIECGFAAATAVFPFLLQSVPGESSDCGRSLPAELVNDTVPVHALTRADRALVAEFFETGPTARGEALEVFHDLRDSTAFAPLVAELKGMLERRAAPFSQNIRKAFEVLVGAARVKKSVRFSEAFIAAHETKRQEDDPMDTD